MPQFVYPVSLLSKGREVLFRPMTYKVYKDLVKTIINNDNNSLVFFIDNLITELCTEKIDKSKLSILDKFYILIFIYGTNLTTFVPLNLTCLETKKKFNFELNLGTLLEGIDKLEVEQYFKITLEGIEYTFSLPKTFINKSSLIIDCLESIRCKEQDIPITTDLLNYIPFVVVNKFYSWLKKQDTILQNFDFINVKSPYAEKNVIKYSPSILNTSLLDFVIAIYKDDLKKIYLTEYDLLNNQNFRFEDFDTLTPADISIYMGIKTKQEQAKPSSLPSTKIPSK